MVLEVSGGRGDCGQVLTGAWRRMAMNSKREDISQPRSAAWGRCAADGTGRGGQQRDWEETGRESVEGASRRPTAAGEGGRGVETEDGN